jgi:transposase
VAVDLDREHDIEELRRIAHAQQAQIRILLDALTKQSKEIERIKGTKGQLQQTIKLIEELQAKAKAADEAVANAEAEKQRRTAARKQRESSGPTEQPRLPRIDREFTLDDADRSCPSCGGGLSPMKDQFETSEMIDVVEVEYRLVQVKQQKYVCRCGGCVETAPGPTRALVGSRYSLAFAIKVILDKWLDHIPLERQVRILDRHGLVVTSQTLWDLAFAVTQRLSRIDAALFDHVKAQPVIGLDQTGWPRLDGGGTKPWQMWCLTAPGVVVHRICDDKSAATFKDLVGDYHGTIVCDALQTHGAGARDGPGIVLAGCWAHVYRRFEEAMPDHPDAERALEWIGALYDLDAAARATAAPPVLAELKAWLFDHAANKTVSIGKAAAYTLGNWDRLTRFVDDPRVPLDNNATERAIRGPVVGRKNHYGSKSKRGTQVAGTLYSVLETAKLQGIDPAAYLAAAVAAAERDELLMPWQFAATPSA